MPRPPVGSLARPRSDRWWCRCFAELVWVDELARAPARSGLRRRTPESGKQSMIVSTWQFLQKQVRGVSLGRPVKGVKLVVARKKTSFRTRAGNCLQLACRERKLSIVEVSA